jgi:MoaA/NifB/PqqE/SkfB family radical SAM enzyme
LVTGQKKEANMRFEKTNQRQRLIDVVPLKAPFSIFIDPCGRCNFKCDFCPCNNSNYRIKERHKMMSLSLFRKIVTDMAEFDEKIKVVNLYGFGEPLINPCTPDMILLLKERSLCREVRMATNGALLTPELNQKLVDSGIDLIRISLESLSEKGYKDICGISLNYGDFVDNIEDLYRRSRGSNTKVAIKLIASTLKSNDDLLLFSDRFASICDYFFVEAEEKYWAEFKMPMRNSEKLDVVRKTMERVTSPCSFPLTDMTIFSNGISGVCCVDWRMDTEIGNVVNQSLLEIWRGERLFEFRNKHLSGMRHMLPACKNCSRVSPDQITKEDTDVLLMKLLRSKP